MTTTAGSGTYVTLVYNVQYEKAKRTEIIGVFLLLAVTPEYAITTSTRMDSCNDGCEGRTVCNT
jgi:hypothetical protein